MNENENENARLQALASAALSGVPVDWDAEATAASEADRPAVQELRVLALMASLSGADDPRGRPPRVTAPHHDDLPSWGHLTLLERVGEGAFGEVYRAWDRRLERQVALKLFTARRCQASAFALLEEARLLARVRHPNVVTVYGADDLGGRIGLWTEFVAGRTLDEIVRQDGPVPLDEAVRIGIDVCRALSAVHRAGLLHRDVKAQNVMREDGGRVVLMDFGMVRRECEAPPGFEGTGGTPLYMAPELFEHRPASVAADIYAAGVLLHRLVTGGYPVTAQSIRELREAHESNRTVPLKEAAPHLPRAFTEVVDRATARDPAERFPTAARLECALAEALGESCRDDEDGAAPARLGPSVRAARRKVALAAAGGTALAAIAAAFLLSSGGPDETPPLAAQPRLATRPSLPQVASPQAAAGSPAADAPSNPVVVPRAAPLAVIQEGAAALAPSDRVTTSSQRARGLYLQSLRAAANNKADAALVLARNAAGDDPAFASAHAWVAYLLLRQEKRDEAAAAIARAATLAVGATASERLFIGAVQKDIERSDQATAAWEAYLDLRPDDTRALDRLVIPWARAGRDDDIARAWMRAARLRPDDYMANHNAAWYGMVYGGRVKDVQPFVARAQALLSPEIDAQLAAWMRLEPVFADWLRGDAPAAARKLERAAARLELRDQAFLLTLASLNVGLGRLRAAEAAIGRLPVEAPKPWLPLAEIAWMRGDLAGARRAIVAAVNDPGSAGLGVNRLVALMVRVGMVEEAERFLAGQPEPIKSRSLAYPPAEGEVALARGDLDRALTGLAGWDKLARGIPARIVAGTSYAEALERQGDLATAARVLEALGGERAHLYQRPSSPIPSWVRSRALLARVYRALGRTGEGEVVQAEVRALLARADSDLAPPLRN